MRALTIRQPYAAAIAHADKRIENRVWRTAYRGPLLIHASLTPDRRPGRGVSAVVRGLQLDLGAVVAVARLANCHPDDGACSPWSLPGHYHHVLEDVTALPLPVPWKGAQGLWTPPDALLARVCLQLDEARVSRLLEQAEPC
ncbi:ASCH domain-containing protein [Streptomyces natalensis]|nr:ASCH domain-containing protein [Streptomyces natalensis]